MLDFVLGSSFRGCFGTTLLSSKICIQFPFVFLQFRWTYYALFLVSTSFSFNCFTFSVAFSSDFIVFAFLILIMSEYMVLFLFCCEFMALTLIQRTQVG